MLLRRVIGDVLRARRQDQHRTLREVSHAANVSLGYLSEIERGQKEASSELLAAICDALGSELSDVLRAASDSLARLERDGAAVPVPALPPEPEFLDPQVPEPEFAEAGSGSAEPELVEARLEGERLVSDGAVAVSVRRDGPLRTTLCAVPARRATAELAAAGSG